MKTLLIWDLDGTLTESKPWIFASYRHGAEAMGLPVPTDEDLSHSLCGNLYSNLKRMYGIEGDRALEFARHYRSYYADNCFDKVELFDGIREALESLHDLGIVQAVATMKPEPSAIALLERLGISDYFVSIRGTDFEGTVTKADMIRSCISTGKYDRVFMLGDCPSDRKAADEAGVAFIAAAFGYGYPVEKCVRDDIVYASKPSDIQTLL